MTLLFNQLLGDVIGSTSEAIVFLSVANAAELVLVTLAPFWLGLFMKIETKLKLIIIPLIPFLVATAFEFILQINGGEYFLSSFWYGIVIILTIVSALSAFVAWIVAWVICTLDRNYYSTTETDTA